MDNGCLVVRKCQVEPAKIERRRWNRRRTTAQQTLTNGGDKLTQKNILFLWLIKIFTECLQKLLLLAPEILEVGCFKRFIHKVIYLLSQYRVEKLKLYPTILIYIFLP